MPRANYNAADTRMVVVVVIIVVTLCYPIVIDMATVVRTEKSGQHLQNVILHGPKNTRVLRSTEDNDNDDLRRYCIVSGKKNSSCGWAIYHPYTRNIEYFMKNTCVCPDSTYKCVRRSDDLSASAYVYYCLQNTTADDIEHPKDTN